MAQKWSNYGLNQLETVSELNHVQMEKHEQTR